MDNIDNTERERQRIQEEALQKANQRRINYNMVFNSPEGQKVLIDIITMCHILEPSPTVEPQQLAFREGERMVGLEILRIMRVNPEKYIKIVKENS